MAGRRSPVTDIREILRRVHLRAAASHRPRPRGEPEHGGALPAVGRPARAADPSASAGWSGIPSRIGGGAPGCSS